MNILHLKYAVEVARTKSISKAAENLYMGQPNLSRAVRDLEESLGITIFRRTSRGIVVTPDGEEFLQYARRILAEIDGLEERYRAGAPHTARFAVCVPRASYISYAFTEFAQSLPAEPAAELYYQETNSLNAVDQVLRGDYNMGIIRYQAAFDRYFKAMFAEKKLENRPVAQFSHVLLVARSHPLAQQAAVSPDDLAPYTEIAHADPYVPSLPMIDVRRAELSENVHKRIYVFERDSQFHLLESVSNTFMWVSPIPEELLRRYHLVQRPCTRRKLYTDVLIRRRDCRRTELDDRFVAAVEAARDRYIAPMEQKSRKKGDAE